MPGFCCPLLPRISRFRPPPCCVRPFHRIWDDRLDQPLAPSVKLWQSTASLRLCLAVRKEPWMMLEITRYLGHSTWYATTPLCFYCLVVYGHGLRLSDSTAPFCFEQSVDITEVIAEALSSELPLEVKCINGCLNRNAMVSRRIVARTSSSAADFEKFSINAVTQSSTKG